MFSWAIFGNRWLNLLLRRLIWMITFSFADGHGGLALGFQRHTSQSGPPTPSAMYILCCHRGHQMHCIATLRKVEKKTWTKRVPIQKDVIRAGMLDKRRAYYKQQDVIIAVCLITKGQRARSKKPQRTMMIMIMTKTMTMMSTTQKKQWITVQINWTLITTRTGFRVDTRNQQQ